ncbi:MAG: hypothetical protein Q8N71_05980 [candidate division Zixibacteria bacterium]|nr:hypothetical protein [candidate division Zixibacteria bacterium]
MRIRNRILLICILLLFACAPTKVKIYPKEAPEEKTAPVEPSPEKPSPEKKSPEKVVKVKPSLGKTYTETISEWKSYQDIVKWMEKDFTFDAGRYKRFVGTLPAPRTPKETFQLKSGIYIDAAMFLKETLNRINPSYKAQVVVLIIRPYGFNHYVCSFKKDGKLFIMDYGTPYREVTGVHGPYYSLEEYKIFYKKYHPMKREVEGIVYLR